MELDIAGILKLFETGEMPEEEKVIEPLTSSISKIETENVAKKSQQMFQGADEVSKLPMPKTYGDMANIIRINSQLPREYKPTMGTIKYVGKAVYSKIFEKYLYGLGEGAAGALAAGAKAVGLKDVASYFEGSKEMWKTPPVTEEVDKQYAYLRDSAMKKSALYGAAVEIAESGAQIGGLLIQMGLLGKVPSLKAFDKTVLSGTAELGKVTKHMATMAVHGLATTQGDLSTRLQSALYRMAYNMTPYIANSTNAIGWGARSIDTSLNMFLTMPSYIAAAKSAKDPMDFIMKSIPQFMSDFIFALNTTGTPLNQRLSLMSKQQKFVNMTRAEKTGYLNLVDKAVAEKWEDTRVYGDEAPAPNKEQLMNDVKARTEELKQAGLYKTEIKVEGKPGAGLQTKAVDILIKRAEEAVTKADAKVEAETKVGKKAALTKKISLLTEPILKGRKLPTEQNPIVLSEHKNLWGRLKDGMLIWAAGNDRPERMFEELDGYKRGRNVEELYVKPNQALDKELVEYNRRVDDVRDTIKRLGLHDNLGEFYGQKKMVGNVLMSDNEAVDIYMSSQNKDGLRHLQKGVGLGDKDIAAVKTKVEGNFKLKALSDWLFTKYEEQYPRLAAAYLAETGKVLPKVPYYSPLRVFKESINFETENIAQEIFEKGQPKGYAYVEKGMTEARKVGAKNPVIMDALGNYLYNLGRVEHYIAFAVPAKEMRTIINNPQWKETVIAQKGRAFYKNVQEYYGAVAGTRPGVAYDMADKTMNILRRHAGTAMLGFNVLTALRQPLSAFQAAGEIGVYHLLNGIKQVGLDPVGIEKFVYDRSPQTKFRMGQFERFMVEQARVGTVEEVIKGPKGLHKLRKVALSPVVFMDKYTVLAVWKGAYDRVYMTSRTLDGERIRSADLERVAAMEADLAVRRTQPMAAAKDLPGWHRSGTVATMFTMFQNQVNNNYNYFKHDIIGKVKSGQITPGTAAYRTLFTYLLPAMVLTMIANGRVKMSKEEAMKALIAYPLSGTFVLGGMINNIMQGYGTWGIPPLQGPIDLIAGAAAKKWTNKAKLGLKGMAEITGIPYNQVYRTYMGMRALMNGETDDWRRLIWSEYALTKQQGDIEELINMFRRE